MGVWEAISVLGSAVVYVPLILVLYWCVSPVWGARLAVLLAFSGVVNELLKTVFRSPRPYWTNPRLRTVEPIASYGMPSGHAQNAVVVWGTLARRRKVSWALALIAMLAIGLSRIFLNVHSPAQVLAGWTVGAVVLLAARFLEPVVLAWWRTRHLAVQLGLSVLLPLILLFGISLAVDSHNGWQMPEAWVEAVRASGGTVPKPSLNNGAAGTGMLAGLLAGLSALAAWGGFDVAGSWGSRLARVPIGLAGFVLLYVVGLAFDAHPALVFVLFLLAGAWASAGAPAAFVGMGLASRGRARTPV